MTKMITEHFKWTEVLCPCCKRVRIEPIFWKHMEMLEDLRQRVGFRIKINSGYRCKRQNTKVGGADGSYHMLFATDIRPVWANLHVDYDRTTLQKKRLEALYKEAMILSFKGLGRGEWFVHTDCRPDLTEWVYTNSRPK